LPEVWTTDDGPHISVRDGRFIDQDGRHVILHGINVGNKQRPYLSRHTEADYAQMNQWGFNCVRLLILWAGIEPECGKYDEEYLKQVAQRVRWAKENHLFVILDMHQDLYGEGIPGGDGAPAWATLNEGKVHSKGAVWSDAYWLSQAVQCAFDNFWANAPAPDGIPIQEHFAHAWQRVAALFADEPAVIGYDLINEPFPGTEILMVGLKVVADLPNIFGNETGANLMKLFDNRDVMSNKLSDLNNYKALLASMEPLFQTFECKKLAPMYQRVADKIRQVDRRHIIFIEPPMSANMGVTSALPPLQGPRGAPDPAQALAPHAYDIVVDTQNADDANESRMNFIFERHKERARHLNLPSLIGEWGAFYGSKNAGRVAGIYTRLFAETLVGDTYWDYSNNLRKAPFLDWLARPYPQAISGIIESYSVDREARTFSCTWMESQGENAPSVFYLPEAWFPNGWQMTLEPKDESARLEPQKGPKSAGYYCLPASNKSVKRALILKGN
jgi:endoglycosylceramidase